MRRPFVTAAFALSADACLAQRRGVSPAIYSLDAKIVAHRLRAANDAVLVGIGTVLSDDPMVATRLVKGPTGLRVVLDAKLRLPHGARLLHAHERRVLIFGGRGAEASRIVALRALGAHVDTVNKAGRGLEPHAVLESFFSAGLIDYVCLTRSPAKVHEAESVVAGPRTQEGLQRWQETLGFEAGGDHVGFGRCS